MSPRSGTFLSVTVISSFIRPAITIVSLSLTTTEVSADLLFVIGTSWLVPTGTLPARLDIS